MELKPGYKQTEVGVIPEDWDALQLNAVCTMKSGEGITASSIDNFSEYPCYGGNGLRGYTRRFTHDGSFALIGRQGALCGNVVSAQGKFFASEHAVVVTPRTGYDIGYLTFVLGEMHLNQYSESSAQPGLSVSKLLKLPLAVPRAEVEQHTIAMALRSVDALLGKLENLIAKKRDIKQAARQELLTGKRRLPGFVGEWEEKRLGELGTWRGGMTPSMQNPSYWVNGGFPWISSGDIKVSQLSETSQNVTSQAVKQGAAVVVPAQTIVLVTRSGILRKYLPVALIDKPMAINQDIKALIPREGICSKFLLHALTWAGDKILASCMKSGTTVESVEFSWLKAFVLPIPLLEEQEAIASVLSEMDAEISALDAQRDRTRALKQAMMQELLTGRIRLR